MATQSIKSDGIFYGLPVIDDAQTNSAIVVGASGMSGQSQIDVLLKSLHRFKRVYALSRRAPQPSPNGNAAEHVPIDLLQDPNEIAAKLQTQKVQA